MYTRFMLLLGAASTCLALYCGLGTESATAAQPVWSIAAVSAPQNLTPGDASGNQRIVVTARNVGDGTAEGVGNEVVVGDVPPAGLTATAVTGIVDGERNSQMVCTLATVTCRYAGPVPSYATAEVLVQVAVASDAVSGIVNRATVSGGNAATASTKQRLSVGASAAGFGIDNFDFTASEEDGAPDTQAGSHPFALTTAIGVNQAADTSPEAIVKDLDVELPPGLVGDPSAIPQCTNEQFETQAAGPEASAVECPDDTAIGVAAVALKGSGGIDQGAERLDAPLYNLAPSVGEPARFGFSVFGAKVYLDTSVRTGGDYGVDVDVSNISQLLGFQSSSVTIWGVPGDASHDGERGKCMTVDGPSGSCSAGGATAPFLTLPTSCTGPLTAVVNGDSWLSPGVFSSASVLTHDQEGNAVGLDGCNRIDFSPRIEVAPNGTAGSTPTGLSVNLDVPQSGDLTPAGLAESDVRKTVVALPEGVQLSPSAADGLVACSPLQIALSDAVEPSCPDASKVATVRIDTPLLPNPLLGEVYLAEQDSNPFGGLLALYLVARDPVSGVLVKLAGQVTPNPLTGQLTATFANTPQLPFTELKLEFFGSARAPLSTPPLCGSYTTQTSIEGWAGGEPSTPSSAFPITSGPGGAPCADPQPFTPGFQAGSTNIQAGAFTPFTLTMTRPDADQTLSGVQLRMPPGLLGTLATVALCPEPQAAQGTCGEASLIGHTVVSAGLGGDPYTVTGGRVYITGPYRGAPFGLSIVNPAVAGPFNLGTVVVRATIDVDPQTAQLTITSDPLPTIIDGIPLQIQRVNVTVDRPGFTFNPTNCSPLQIDATLSSSAGQSAPESTPFQITNCASLAFHPTFKASTSGQTSRAGGASLEVKLTYPSGPYDANIASVKVELPKKLPSRLTTLQKACPAATFAANPAACPTASLIGVARAVTPVLPVALSGPAYFVSHGGEAFPSLIVVLQGYGVRVDLVGSTFISKAGITSSTFKTVPDVPVGTFELYLPEGRYSALAANGDLCKASLVMPTTFVAQNGAQLHQNTSIAVTGCAKAKRAKKANRVKKRGKAAKASAGSGARTTSHRNFGHGRSSR
jgi:hypothetical protein